MLKNTLQNLLILVAIILVMKSRIRCLANDESSLLALKHRITTNTMLSENWTQGTPFCSWMGVSCSLRHPFRVTSLNLSYMGLQGNIPQEIGNLSFLSYLNIRNNSFSGPIPDTIGNLGRLRTLLMNNNELSGPIPPSLFNISSLQIIYLGANHLFGNLPQNYISHQLPNLQYLDFGINQLSGTIPQSIFNISSLIWINLGGNMLSGTLPDQDICRSRSSKLQVLGLHENQIGGDLSSSSLWACEGLERLYLYSNNLTGSIPMYIGKNLSQLQILNFRGNQLTGILPPSIGNLSKLERFDAAFNSLHGRVPPEIGWLSNLNSLDLASNNLNGEIPASLYNLSKLQSLSISLNELSGELPSSLSTGLPNLEELYVLQNRFTGAVPTSISNLSQLSEVELGNNSFSGHIPISLGNLPNLRLLSLFNNDFSNNLSIPEENFLTPLANCKYMEVIDFYNNTRISGELPRSFFSSANISSSLERLFSSSCEISGKIPSEVGSLNSLIWLDMNNNKLVGAIPESFRMLAKLQRLELNDNMLQESIPSSICNMTSLYHLGLSRNKLSGQLPLCLGTDLSSLRELYLSENAFDGNISFALWANSRIERIRPNNNFFYGTISQEIGNLKNLLELNISGNQLSGNIPNSIGQLQSIIVLSISNNRLNGSIPDSLSNLKGLEHLDLSHNNLSGPIPQSLTSLAYLQYFDVSFNQLSGEIPNQGPFRNFTDESFIGNKDLCGVARTKVKPCIYVTHNSSHKHRLITRYILPPVLALSIFAVATIIFFRVRYQRRKSSNTSPLSPDLPLGLSFERISYYDILHATRNFDEEHLIGRGSYGSVYKGKFPDVVIAAVKVFNMDTQESLKSFDTECKILRSIRHRNLVKVMTSCSNTNFKALVMEYMPNGNLDRWLHSTEYSLNIFQRFGIMVDVANALEYLHNGGSTSIIHCDLKPSNILLDNNMVARVSDFGIAKLLTEEEIVQQTKTLGTIGYMAPEYGSGGFVSTSADVYSYGIVLLEIVTGNRPTNEMFSEELTIKKWVSESFPDSVMQIFDFELLNTNQEDAKHRYKMCLTSIIALALECLAEMPEERPSMNEVVRKIEKIKIDLALI